MKFLADAMPAEFPSQYRAGAQELKQILIDAIRPGDVVMVKSSKGIGFSKIVEALIKRFPDDAGTGQLS